mgnify:FL=1|jgi:hypothetical protein
MKKTMWQKIYSFFGFWHYYETTEIEEQLKKKYETDWNYGRGEGC